MGSLNISIDVPSGTTTKKLVTNFKSTDSANFEEYVKLTLAKTTTTNPGTGDYVTWKVKLFMNSPSGWVDITNQTQVSKNNSTWESPRNGYLDGETDYVASATRYFRVNRSVATNWKTSNSVAYQFRIYSTAYIGTSSAGGQSYVEGQQMGVVGGTLYFVNNSYFSPTFLYNIEDVSDHPEDGNWVPTKNLSKFRIQIIDPTFMYGATLKSYKIEAFGYTAATNDYTTPVITQAGTFTIKMTLTDSRGLSLTATATRTVRDVLVPSLTNVFAERCDEDGTLNDEGAYVLAHAEYSVDSTAGAELTSSAIFFGKNEPLAPLVQVVDNFESGKPYIIGGDLLTDSEYIVRFEVHDSFGLTGMAGKIISVSFYTLDFLAGGKGVAIGKAATREGFDVAMESYMEGVNVDHLKSEKEVEAQRFISVWTGTPQYVARRPEALWNNDESGNTTANSWNVFSIRGANDYSTAFIELYRTATDYHTSALVTSRKVGTSAYYNQVRCDISPTGAYSYYITNPAGFRTAISALTYKLENGYMGVADPSGNNTSGSGAYLRTPSAGLIPYKSGTNASLGTSSWQFSTAHVANYYRNNAQLFVLTALWTGTVSKNGSITVASLSKYRLFAIRPSWNGSILLVGFSSGAGSGYLNGSNIYNNATSTWTMQATFQITSSTTLKLIESAYHHQATNQNLGSAMSVTGLYGMC